MDASQLSRVEEAVGRFTSWLARYGETSHDYQSFFASDATRKAKALYYRKPFLGTIAVSPIIFCEAFIPAARKLFWKAQRFPKADAHSARGFAFHSTPSGDKQHYQRAVHFLDVL